MELLINPQTNTRVKAFCNDPGHALLITGSIGAGKATIAEYIAAQLLNISPESTSKHPYLLRKGNDTTLTIAEVREVKEFLRLKVPSNDTTNRVIILENVDFAGHEAQNALLKFVEEPPKNTVLLLTASHPHKVLQTIRSRSHLLEVLPVSQKQAEAYYKDTYGAPAVTKAYLLSEGNAGLMNSILMQENTLFTEQIDNAKQLIVSDQFERLKRVDELTKNKETLPYFLIALERICSSGLVAAGNKNNTAAINRWNRSLRAVLAAQKALELNGNTKLVMCQLFLHL